MPDEPNILHPDKYRLDEEWEGQPRLFRKYSKKLAKAQERLDVCKAALKFTDAELSRDIRDDPKKFKIKGATSAPVVAHTIELCAEHRKMVAKVNKAQFKVNDLLSMVRTLDQRKAALENLVKLHGQSYFATPRITGGDTGKLREKVNEVTMRRSSKKLTEKRKNRKAKE